MVNLIINLCTSMVCAITVLTIAFINCLLFNVILFKAVNDLPFFDVLGVFATKSFRLFMC